MQRESASSRRRGLFSLCYIALVVVVCLSIVIPAQAEESLPRECERDPTTGKVACDLPDHCEYDGKVIRCTTVTNRCIGNACRDILYEESGMQACVTITNQSTTQTIKVTLISGKYSTTKRISPGGWRSFSGQYGGCFSGHDYGGMKALYEPD
jgi:hypothetical protein